MTAVSAAVDPRQWFCWRTYFLAAVFYSVYTLMARGGSRGAFPNKFAKPFSVVLAVHSAGVLAVWSWITAYIFGYSSMPSPFLNDFRVGHIGSFNIAEILLLAPCAGIGAWERFWIKPQFVPRPLNQGRVN
jgi:hypothetical protein